MFCIAEMIVDGCELLSDEMNVRVVPPPPQAFPTLCEAPYQRWGIASAACALGTDELAKGKVAVVLDAFELIAVGSTVSD